MDKDPIETGAHGQGVTEGAMSGNGGAGNGESEGALSALRRRIISELAVRPDIEPAAEITQRVDFIARYLRATGARALVLGISGGQDSTLCGRLCQLAVEQLNTQEHAANSAQANAETNTATGTGTGENSAETTTERPAKNTTEQREYAFYAIRLPYGVQADEEDAQRALEFIRPTHTLTINIDTATDTMLSSVNAALRTLPATPNTTTPAHTPPSLSDFNKGNIKARQRMIAQYAVAGHLGALVVGTDHAAEALTGFYTKHGDGAADLFPLAGLSKRQGAALLRELGAPPATWEKTPTADLEENRPALPDSVALGVSYEHIDAYLEGAPLPDDAARTIEQWWLRTRHKRALPVTPHDTWWHDTP